jgi:hypothetical protein
MLSPLRRLTSRLSVSSWPPELPRSAFDAHWPPLEAWHLACIRIAATGSIYPLTCEKGRAERGACVSAINDFYLSRARDQLKNALRLYAASGRPAAETQNCPAQKPPGTFVAVPAAHRVVRREVRHQAAAPG